MAEELLIIPAIFLGTAIGIYEAILLHRDVSVPTHRLGHTLHALFFAIIGCFITMNTEFVVANVPQLQDLGFWGSAIFIQLIVGLIMAVKIHAVSRAIQSSLSSTVGLGETWTHSLLVGGLIVAAPYVWPFLSTVVPPWLGGMPAE